VRSERGIHDDDDDDDDDDTSYEAPHYAVLSTPHHFIIASQILLTTLFSHISACVFSLSVRDQNSHPCKEQVKLSSFYVSIFKFSERRREDKRL
jgi:hypothetical protein